MKAKDPMKLYVGFLAALNATIGTYEDIIEMFSKAIEENALSDFGKRLTVDAIDFSLFRLKRIEARLERLRSYLLSEIGGDER
jgi:hypothetical protein